MEQKEITDKIADEFIEKLQKLDITDKQLVMFIALGQKPLQDALSIMNAILGHEKATQVLQLYVDANKQIVKMMDEGK